jgi:CRISPR-associated protein Csb1
LGGVVARGPIERHVTVNLVALRRFDGGGALALRRYILGLSLVAATEPLDGFLRQGCLLTPDPAAPGEWMAIGRDGVRSPVSLTSDVARAFAAKAAEAFGVGQNRRVAFKKELAQADLKDTDKKKAAGKAKASK